jgi:hypothetical protein
VRPLPAHRKTTPMTQPAIGADVHQTLDVHLNALAQVAFNLALSFDDCANAAEIIFGQISHARIDVHVRFMQNRS